MSQEKVKVLIVDDKPQYLLLLQEVLEYEDYDVITAESGELALKLFEEKQPSLILLDILLPGIDGYAVCRKIRERSNVPIIMVTGKKEEEETIQGLNSGADDYLIKPFRPKELVARVEAVLRRSSASQVPTPEQPPQDNKIKVDFARREVTINGEQIDLTVTEYNILSFFANHANQTIDPNKLISEVWGEVYSQDVHLLRVNIGRLRQKLNDSKGNKYIKTRPGFGYVFNN